MTMAPIVSLTSSQIVSTLSRHCICRLPVVTLRKYTVDHRMMATTTLLKINRYKYEVVKLVAGSTIHFPTVSDGVERRKRIESSNIVRCFADATSHTTKNININVQGVKKRKETHEEKIITERKDEIVEDRTYEHFVEQLMSLPNIITTTRMMTSPLLSYFVITNQVEYAVIGCFIAAVSDVADGYIARNYNMTTTLGSYLDPLADKIMINVISASLCINGTLPATLVSLFMIRDVALVYGTYAFVRDSTKQGDSVLDPSTTPLKVNPTTFSKINTGLQFATISIGVGIEPLTLLYPTIVPDILTSLCWITGTTTVLSGFSYIGYSAFSASGNKMKKHSQDLQQSVKRIIQKTKSKITVGK